MWYTVHIPCRRLGKGSQGRKLHRPSTWDPCSDSENIKQYFSTPVRSCLLDMSTCLSKTWEQERVYVHACVREWESTCVSYGEVSFLSPIRWEKFGFRDWTRVTRIVSKGAYHWAILNVSRTNPWRPSSMCCSICPPTKKCLQYIQYKMSIWVYEGYIGSFKRYWYLSSAQT